MKYLRELALTGCLLVCFGCSSSVGGIGENPFANVSTSQLKSFEPAAINKVGVVPLKIEGSAAKLSQASERKLTQKLFDSFDSYTTLELELLEDSAHRGSVEQIAKNLAKTSDVQGVLFGVVKDNSGDESLLARPNESIPVRFNLWLYDKVQNQIVWSAQFQDSNQPLSSNLFAIKRFFNRGGSYRSSLRILQDGFREAARSIEKVRQP